MRYTVALTVRFTEEMLEELRRIAEREQRSVGAVIRMAVEQTLESERILALPDGDPGRYWEIVDRETP